DWTISRQIWWGHRIPAWYCDACDHVTVATEDPSACASCGGSGLSQDADVLDTWFSSALFPFSTLGWPEDTADMERFYPNDILITGFDIIYFWVARMIKMGIHFPGEKPFSDVIIHGLVRAADGRKMSKSLGNALDPLDVVEEHGADALRLALIQAAAPGQDVPFQIEWVDAARRFGNKLWNAVRFGMTNVSDVPAEGGYPQSPGPEAAWILARLHEVTAEVNGLLDEYRFSDAYGRLYSFAWSEVFDWYLELAKAPIRDGDHGAYAQTVGVVLRDLLKLFHPVIPFVTEELWSHLVGGDLLAGSTWPQPPAVEAPASFDTFQDLVTKIRRFRAEHGLSPRHPLDVVIVDPDGLAEDWWTTQFASIASFTPTWANEPDREGRTRIVSGSVQAFISLEGIVDVDAERERLSKAIADAEGVLSKAQAKLANENFVARAPEAVVAKERAKAEELQARLDKLQTQLDELS
ncbi:MAG TPA: class I tRNA ligase family protein, partial [Acidimicrobiia bacterium]|nr:class I tRNA ligase family protein [Acidimicrobiia bacterium]